MPGQRSIVASFLFVVLVFSVIISELIIARNVCMAMQTSGRRGAEHTLDTGWISVRCLVLGTDIEGVDLGEQRLHGHANVRVVKCRASALYRLDFSLMRW